LDCFTNGTNRFTFAKRMAELRAINMSEVAQHNTEDDCWIVVHGLVLSLPKAYLNEHPGGSDVITALAGQDATNDFEDIAHSDSSRAIANQYVIGQLVGAGKTTAFTEIPRSGSKQESQHRATGLWAVVAGAVVFSVGVVGYKVFKG